MLEGHHAVLRRRELENALIVSGVAIGAAILVIDAGKHGQIIECLRAALAAGRLALKRSGVTTNG